MINCLARYIAHRNELSAKQYNAFLKEIIIRQKNAILPSMVSHKKTVLVNKGKTQEHNPEAEHDSLKSSLPNNTIIKERIVVEEVTALKENVIRNGKVVTINDPDLLTKVSPLIGTNRLDAIKLLIDFFDGQEDIKMSFKDWGKLLDRIPAISLSENVENHHSGFESTLSPVKTTIIGDVQNSAIAISKDSNGHRSGVKTDWDEVDNAIEGIDNVHDIFGTQEDFPSFVIGSFRLEGIAISLSVKAWSSKTDKRYIIHLFFNYVSYYHASITTSQDQTFRIACKKYKDGFKYRIGDNNIYINSGKARVIGISVI